MKIAIPSTKIETLCSCRSKLLKELEKMARKYRDTGLEYHDTCLE
jgi:hypothetical protein